MRRWHRWLGIALLAPLAVWIATGAVFLVRPGYESAYADLEVRHYPLAAGAQAEPRAEWHGIRRLRTILGPHLLVRDDQGEWRQLDPETLQPRPRPGEASIRRLVADAIGARERYGDIEAVSADRIRTTTGVAVELDWDRLALDQRGRDTRWISWAYDIHRMQWTGIGPLDLALGALALLLLTASATIGARLLIRPGR